MTDERPELDPAELARSFSAVADVYERARPSYPVEAVGWLIGATPARVLELGAGTGKLTEQLRALGHAVVATDPLPSMLALLREKLPDIPVAVAVAERIPVHGRTIDVVVSAQAFHWFDQELALPEIARALRPEGVLALVWNQRDDRIPWVRKLGELIGTQEQLGDPTDVLVGSKHFGYVEAASFRFWQPLGRAELRDLVRSRSNVAVLDPAEREALLARVDALYDEYSRGPEGLKLPYLTRCFRAVVRPLHVHEDSPEASTPGPADPARPAGADPDGPGTTLIDFR